MPSPIPVTMPDPPSLARRSLSLLKAVPGSLVLLVTILLCNLLQMLSLLLWPLSRGLVRRANGLVAASWWGLCVVLARWLNGVRLVVTGDPLPAGENALVVSNHQQMTDIPFLLDLALRNRRLHDLKWFVKDALRWVPGIGWGMVFLDCVFVRRHWERDREQIARAFARIRRDRVPIWLVLFAEGTRVTVEKLARSNALARERGLPETSLVLLPRSNGFVATLDGLGDHLDAIYDVTIAYPDGIPRIWQYVRGFVPVAHVDVRRAARRDLPEDREGRERWLVERFHDKDRRLIRFRSTGSLSD